MSTRRSEYEQFLLQSNNKKTVDIRLGVASFDYYEDIFSPTVTAKVLVANTGETVPGQDGKFQSLYNGLPLRGGERLSIKIKPNSETNRAYRSLHENGSALVAKFHKELVKFFPSLKRQDLVEKLFAHAGYLHFRSVYKPEEAISL